jgi:hypothetical protein
MFTPLLAHIAGVPVEETLLSVGPALVAAVSVSLVHIRSLRNPSAFADDDDESAEDGEGEPEGRHHAAGDAVDPGAGAEVDALGVGCREDDRE